MSEKLWVVSRRIGGEYIESIRAVSAEHALAVVSYREGIDRHQLNAVFQAEPFVLRRLPDRTLPEADLGMLPYISQELGPEFSETGPADPGKKE